MLSFLMRVWVKCCPWFGSQELEDFKKVHETEGESFMKDLREPPTETDQQHHKIETVSTFPMGQSIQQQEQP